MIRGLDSGLAPRLCHVLHAPAFRLGWSSCTATSSCCPLSPLLQEMPRGAPQGVLPRRSLPCPLQGRPADGKGDDLAARARWPIATNCNTRIWVGEPE